MIYTMKIIKGIVLLGCSGTLHNIYVTQYWSKVIVTHLRVSTSLVIVIWNYVGIYRAYFLALAPYNTVRSYNIKWFLNISYTFKYNLCHPKLSAKKANRFANYLFNIRIYQHRLLMFCKSDAKLLKLIGLEKEERNITTSSSDGQ